MSSLFVRVCTFNRAPHPNADSLFLANPEGTSWQCCARIQDFEDTTVGVYIPIDTMIPPDLAELWGLPDRKPGMPYRLKTRKFRGEVAQGLLLPLKDVQPRLDHLADVGDDVADELKLTKWVEPEKFVNNAKCYMQPPGFEKYTDIENIKNFPQVLQEGEEVWLSEKIHGANFRAGWVITDEGVKFLVGTRRMVLDYDAPESAENTWVKVAKRFKLPELLAGCPGWVVYGELFGKGVQKLEYDLKEASLRIFDVYDGTKYLDYEALKEYIGYMDGDIELVPVMYEGPWSKELLEYRAGKSTIAGHIREGVVIKPVKERDERGLGRVVLKAISEAYLLKDYE